MQNAYLPFPPSLEERYKNPSFISAGGAGAVYAARDSSLNKKVAIKLLSINSGDQKLVRFQQEAKVIGKFNHSNIVTALDFGIVDETIAYLVLELVGDASLNTLIQRRDPISISKCLNIFGQICAGMSYAHEQGVLHRDLKPGNVLLENSASDAPVAKVADFGIAKIAGTLIFATTGNIYIGTPAYTSPEQFSGEDIDERSDVYSFGCLMFATLTGEAPFSGDNTTELALKHTNDPVPEFNQTFSGEDIPILLQEIVETCLEKSPDNRYANFAEVRELLAQAQKEWLESESAQEDWEPESFSTTASSNPYSGASDGLPFQLNENRRSKQLILAASSFTFVILAVICASLFGFGRHSFTEDKTHGTTSGAKSKPVNSELNISYSDRSTVPKANVPAIRLPESMLDKPLSELIRNADYEMDHKQPATAMAYLERVLLRQPESVKALRLMSDCKKDLKDYGGALVDISTAINLSPKDEKLILRRAQLRKDVRDYNSAVDDYTAYIKIKSDNARAYRDLAKVYSALEKYDEAIATYTKGLTVDPKDVALYRGRGRSYHSIRQYDKALADCNKAISLDPASDENYQVRGDTLVSLKLFQKAIEDYTKAIEIDPKSGVYYQLRGFAYEQIGEKELAARDRAHTPIRAFDIK